MGRGRENKERTACTIRNSTGTHEKARAIAHENSDSFKGKEMIELLNMDCMEYMKTCKDCGMDIEFARRVKVMTPKEYLLTHKNN